MTDIQKFDPATLMNGVRDRIKATFISLIPDEQWEQLVQKEVDDFFKQKEDSYRREYKSDFQHVCRSVIHELATEKAKEFMKDYENTMWSNGKIIVNHKLKELIVSQAPDILESIIGSYFQTAINNMKNRGY